MEKRYEKRGVSASKDEVHRAIKGLDKGLFPNAFCKILPDISGGDSHYCNIMHADTAGTKTALAYIYWRETGDLSVWKGIVQDAIVMNLDDMACAGCTDHFILSSTIGRNKNLISGDVISTLINHTYAFAEKMAEYGVHIYPAGGETADVGDIVRTIDVGYTAFARIRRSEVIDIQIKEGDTIVGFASYGQASYEDTYNGGMGSNGLTSARHDLFSAFYKAKYPDSFDPNIPFDMAYTGSKMLLDEFLIDNNSVHFGKLVLSPTRTYLPLLVSMVPQFRKYISALIHCTGGGQTKVMKFIHSPLTVIKDNLLPMPPLFEAIHKESGTSLKEMYEVFNMGHRLEAYVSDTGIANEMIAMARELKIDAQIVGRVSASQHKKLVVASGGEVIEYA